MEEEKYLQALFEQAKADSSKPSFEEVANHFGASVETLGWLSILKQWWSQYSYLKYFVMFSILSSITLIVYLISSTNNSTTINSTSRFQIEKWKQPLIDENDKLNTEIIDEKTTLSNKRNAREFTNHSTANKANVFSKAFDKVDTTNFDKDSHLDEKISPILLNTKRRYDPLTSLKQSPIPILDSTLKKTWSNSTYLNTQADSSEGYGSTITTNQSNWSQLTNTFHKTYFLSFDGTTHITNEFGKVNVRTWEQDSVKINVLITVRGDKIEKIKRVLENVEIEFSQIAKEVKAQTVIRNKKRIKWYNRKNWTVNIDYEVLVPQKSNLNIQHQNGDINIANLEGKADLKLQFGNLVAENIGGGSRIVLANGKGRIQNAGDILSDLHFAELLTGQVGAVNLNLNNASFETKTAKNISGNSTYGKLKLGVIKDYKVSGTGNNIQIVQAEQIDIKDINAKIIIERAKDLTANLSFSDFHAQTLEDITLDISNTTFKTEQANYIIGNSTWGNINLGTIKKYENNSKGTEVNIGTVDQVKARGYSTKMSIGKLKNSLNLDFHFGHCNATLLGKTHDLNLVGKNADFNFKIPKQATLNVDINSNSNNCSLPADLQINHEVQKIAQYELQGILGKTSNSNRLKAQLTWGKLDVKYK